MKTIELRAPRLRATVVPAAGGRIHQLSTRLAGRWEPLLHAPGDLGALLREPLAYGSYVMAPWPGRVAGARFQWRGAHHELPATLGPHAIHGRAVWLPWQVDQHTDRACRLSVTLDNAWPFRDATVTQDIRLDGDAIEQRVTISASTDPFPAAAGWHPWFRRHVAGAADVAVTLPASVLYETVGLIPTGATVPVAGDFDLRDGPPIAGRALDDCYILDGDSVLLDWGHVKLRINVSDNVRHAVVYTTPHAVCVEPQTAANDAFNLDSRGIACGLTVVEPGSPLTAWTRWTVEP